MKFVKVRKLKALVQNTNLRFITIAFLAIFTFSFAGCSTIDSTATTDGNPASNETAAVVNGEEIKLEEVERAIKQQSNGQESNFAPLELAQARLQVLDSLIQQEVMYQKAVKEETVPTDEEINAEYNKARTESGMSAEEFDKQLKGAGQTEATARESLKKGLAIQKLLEKITGKIEPPKENEIQGYFEGNKDYYTKKRGVRLAAIVIDPANSGEGDPTKNVEEATARANEVQQKLTPENFATLAREYSEDQSKFQGGEIGFFSEEQLQQNFSPQLATAFMDEKFGNGGITPGLNLFGKIYFFKMLERNDKEEEQTLESPGVRQDIADKLVKARKQLLAASYQTIAMNEAKIENYLAEKVVSNPNELSGARPAGAVQPTAAANANTNAAAKTETNAANTNANTNAASVEKKETEEKDEK